MRYEIIKLENYLLVVDDSDIEEGNFVLSRFLVVVPFDKNYKPTSYKKIIAHLPLNNSPILEGVDLLPPLETDEDFNPTGEYTKEYMSSLMFDGKSFVSDVLLATRIGYNKAKEKFHISKEKILNLYIEECGYGMDMWSKEENDTMTKITKIIQSISQPKLAIGFECDMKCGRCYMPLGEDECWSAQECVQGSKSYSDKQITTTNSQGKSVWVGKYIYA